MSEICEFENLENHDCVNCFNGLPYSSCLKEEAERKALRELVHKKAEANRRKAYDEGYEQGRADEKAENIKNTVPEWIFADIPCCKIDFKTIEKVLGIKLFTWQKSYIAFGEFRRSGKTLAMILQQLLNETEEPITLRRPMSRQEEFYQKQLFEVRKKLVTAGIKCREIERIKGNGFYTEYRRTGSEGCSQSKGNHQRGKHGI